jgi:hypothetical protein
MPVMPAATGRWMVFALLCLAPLGQKDAAVKKVKPDVPHSCAGIEIEAAHDADVQKQYGKGYFVADESHLGGRYYIDTAHTVTLHVQIGTDRGIDGVEVQEGIHLPRKPTPQMLKAAETPRLPVNIKIDGELALGATLHEVRARYGKPTTDRQQGDLRTLGYTIPGSAHSLEYDVNFIFSKGRLTHVLFDLSD